MRSRSTGPAAVMPSTLSTKARACPRILRAAVLALLLPAAQAHELPGAVQLGMTAEQLQQAIPALQPVRRPARLAGGLVGSWSGAPVDLEGVALTPTFYMADGQLQRIEYLAQPGVGAQAFDALVRWGRAAFGPESASGGPEGQYATWADEAMDVYLQRTPAQVRLVVKQRVLKDASEL